MMETVERRCRDRDYHPAHTWGYPPARCPGYARSTPNSTTGTPAGEGSVPVVDLTHTLRDLYDEAERCRQAAHAAEAIALNQRRHADYLEDLARILAGE